mmetsp:Transcript_14084/g.23433  ORF Transcript_14084/g.23433 Transcript_14084/m.23433 type:complete len:173 (-) Transcript_14084:38-556(-)|eukprot:CAMPEP_0174970662 /NCGR_PEP_ID=MMETSP0004_2-20121128/9525_1 /TAXON_ID=420556 /ORGANISM="Ochromonas sp., Strain CCMP1393" /LENGTH=172 /DNA_ID=CAMNT_0016220453 /DNA_START=56 /DNA_END=574 /DNA_ORIENTATION=-
MSEDSLAWKLVLKAQSDGEEEEESDAKVNLQLKSIFLSFDTDNDGYINSNQVSDALSHLGFCKQDRVLQKIYPDDSWKAVGVDFDTFVRIVRDESRRLTVIREELDSLFDFIDGEGTGRVTIARLRQLLTTSEAGFQMSPQEFTNFLNIMNIAPEQSAVDIPILKKYILLAV